MPFYESNPLSFSADNSRYRVLFIDDGRRYYLPVIGWAVVVLADMNDTNAPRYTDATFTRTDIVPVIFDETICNAVILSDYLDAHRAAQFQFLQPGEG